MLIFIILFRRYMGRVIIICLFLFVAFFVFKWLNPWGADMMIERFQQIPSCFNDDTTNTNKKVITDQEDISTKKQKKEESSSWFSKIFKKKATNQWMNKEESTIWTWITNKQSEHLDKRVSTEVNISNSSTNKDVAAELERWLENPASMSIWGNNKNTLEDDEEKQGIIYIPSNEKPAHQKTTDTLSKERAVSQDLSTEDIKEAKEIFGGI